MGLGGGEPGDPEAAALIGHQAGGVLVVVHVGCVGMNFRNCKRGLFSGRPARPSP